MKYLFSCGFADGSIYTQNEQDVSIHNPLKSCFYDIKQEEEKGNAPTVFTLSNENDVYLVDLTDGRFEVNGTSFFLHNEPLTGPFRLIFFRRHTHLLTVGFEEKEHLMSFNFGWQTTQNGENIQRIMTIY